MMVYNLHDDQIEEFFASARERYQIFLNRQAGQPKPWTEDKVFSRWRFCNVFREDDIVTEWIRDNVRQPLRNDPRVLLAMVICRFFNRIDTLEIIHEAGLFENWDSDKAYELLKDKTPIVGAAYVIKTPNGMNKLKGVLHIIDTLAPDALHLATRVEPDTTLEGFWEVLQGYPFMGRFMSYEVVSDLRHTSLLENAPDINSWACPGPGACLGLSWLVGKNLEVVPYGGKKKRAAAIMSMQRLLAMSRSEVLWPKEWPQWEMREVEHWLCEYAKYVKVKHLKMRMKRKYQ